MPKQEFRKLQPDITMPEITMNVIDAIYKRHAVRAYTTQKIDEKTIWFLLDTAVHAPTALHEEPWAFAVIQDKDTLKRLSDSTKKTLGDAAARGHAFERFLQPDSSVFYDAGTLIVIYGRPAGAFVAADCWLAAENLMLAACSLGLGTCVIGLAVTALNTPEWKKALGIPADMTAYAPIIVGEPSGKIIKGTRKKPEILVWR